ncbi:MAG: ABC transporter substrate-binding protein [Verrucomicrobiia bacterium]
MKTLFQTTLVISALTLLAGCATSPPPPVAANPAILRVGVTPNSPPMIFKQGGQIIGVEADLAQALGRDLGRQVVFVELKWEDLMDALDEDRIDIIMSSLSITPARRYRIAFTNPYLKVGQMALVRSEDKYKFMLNLAGSAQRGIGVKPGTTAELLVRQEYPRAKVKYYRSGEGAAAALAGQNLDLFLSDSPMIWYLGGRYEARGLTVAPMVFTEEYLGWGVRRADDRLRAAANVFLQKSQENGELKRILRRWMPGFNE